MIESRPFGGVFCTQVHGRPEPTSSSVRASESVTLPARRVRRDARDSEVKVSRGSNLCRGAYVRRNGAFAGPYIFGAQAD
jgi:hypothetical protein